MSELEINLVAVKVTDPWAIDFLYNLCRERETENKSNISFKMPTYDEHRDFVMSNPYRVWFLICIGSDHERAGYITLSYQNEIGIYLARRHRGKGIGFKVIEHITDKIKPLPAIPGVRSGKFLANINPDNKASIKLFKGLGFKLKQVTYAKE